MKYICPCCGYKTFIERPQGNYDICPVCFWEDEPIDGPDIVGGANKASLRKAQSNFFEYGACDQEMKKYVRAPSSDETRDVTWKPLN